MKLIQSYETAIKNEVKSLKDEGINRTMFWAYRSSKEAKADELNFYDEIWDSDIDYIVDTCRKEGIERITISSTFSGIPVTLWEFVKRGCELGGMKLVPSYYIKHNWQTGEDERDSYPAVIIKIN